MFFSVDSTDFSVGNLVLINASKLAAVVAIFTVNFLGYKLLVFRR